MEIVDKPLDQSYWGRQSCEGYATSTAVAAILFALTAGAFYTLAHRLGCSTAVSAIVGLGGAASAASVALVGRALATRLSSLQEVQQAAETELLEVASSGEEPGPSFSVRYTQDDVTYFQPEVDERSADETEDEYLLCVITTFQTSGEVVSLSLGDGRALTAAYIGASMVAEGNTRTLWIMGDEEKFRQATDPFLHNEAVRTAKTPQEITRALASAK